MNRTLATWGNKAVALAVALIFASGLAAFGVDSGWLVLKGNVPPAVPRLVAKSVLPATNELSLAIGLPLRNPAGLDQLLQQLYDPVSTNFHKFLTPSQIASRFGPTEQDYQNVIDFARANGLRVDDTFSNHLVLGISGRVSDVENAFHVSLRVYKHPTENRDFYAPDTDPSVPANLNVISVEGLDNYSLPRHVALMQRSAGAASPAAFNGSGPSHEYAGIDFRNAYAPGTTLTGAGQSVAVLEYSDYFPVDITNYENVVGAVIGSTNYVPLVNIVTSGPTPGTGNNLEVALDIEVAISMAPMLSHVYVYEKSSVSSTLMNRIATDDLAKQVSSSWSVGNWSSSTATTYDGILKTMAAQGQSFFQASGDSDAYTGTHPLDSGVTIPVDSPYATIVGGSTLAMNGSGASWSSETVWNYNTSGIPNEGSGGGISAYYAEPWWQTNISMRSNQGSTAYRNIPDVALTADNIFVSYNNGDFSGSSYALGTSAAAPLWAGFCALANQMSLATNGTTLGFLNPTLYNIAISSCYKKSFHDITTGNNIGTNTPGYFNAVAGYDLCTGLGTPAGTNLINALVWPPPLFTNQPVGETVTNGVSVTLTAGAGSQTPFAYFWLCNGTNLAASGNVSGTTTDTLTITAAGTNNSGNYQLVASNFTGSVTTLVAVVNVGVVPAVAVTPTSVVGLIGSNATFTATASGTAPFSYQWRKNGTNFAGAGISGTNSDVLTLANLTSDSAGNYTVIVTNLFGGATSSVATLAIAAPPSITSSSLTNRIVQCGSNNLTFTVAATGDAPLSYQWSLDGTPVASATNTSFSITNLSVPDHTVSVQVTNLYAASSSNALITVQDTIGPAITLIGANPITLELGNAYVDPGATATDLCAGAVAVVVNGLVNTNAASTNTVVYSATDGSGNTNFVNRTVIVRDTTPPTISWSFTNLVLATDTNCTAVMPNVTGTNCIIASDLSGSLTCTQEPTNNATLFSGTNIIVITVTDGSGNAAYSTNTIVVQDQTPPVITLSGANPTLVELGQAFIDPGATADDACAGPEPVVVSGSVVTNIVGTNTLIYTAEDNNGNTNTVTRTVVVRDTTPPTIVWSFTNLVLAANSNCVALMPDATGTNYIQATDLSGVAGVVQNPTNGATLPLGTNIVVLSVSDLYGNTAYSTNTIAVQDQLPPTISLLGASLMFGELGQPFTDPGINASDDCSGIASVTTNGVVNVSVVGTNILTYVVIDGSGNSNSVSRTVVIRDTTAPTIFWTFTNLIVAANSNCAATMPDVTGTDYVQMADLSGVSTVSQNPTNGATLLLGTNTIVLAATDTCGNTAYSTNSVVVQDQVPPTVTLWGSDLMFSELGQSFTDPGVNASDDCSGIALVKTNGAVNVNAVGTNILTYVAIDGSGNSNSVTRTVIVGDTTPPAIVWSFTNLVLAANSNCVAMMPTVTGTNFMQATDLSGVANISQNPTNGTALALGTNVVVLAVTDPYGNTAYSTNAIVVQDQTPPTLTLVGSNMLYSELGQSFTDPGVAASDDCSDLASVKTNGVVNVNAVGTNILMYMAIDGSGNSNSVTRTITVRDTTPPTIVWSFTNLVLAANSNCVAMMPTVTGTNFIQTTDLSGVASISQIPTNGSVLALGTNVVVLVVADPYGNTAYSTNIVVVRDQTPPLITLVGSNLLYNELGQSFTDPGVAASDACSGLASVKTNGVVNVNAVGTNVLTYVAIDGSGNSNSVTRTVIVRDTTPPTIMWSFTNLVLAGNSNCVAMMPTVTGTNFIQATDLSGVASISQIPTNGSVLALGSNVVVLAVTDPYGNTAYSTNIVVVRDQTPPLITLVGSSLLYSELGQPFTDPGVNASDACSGIALVKTNGAVIVSVVGANILTYVAIDGSGNSNSVTRTVIVRDTTAPTIVWSFTNLVLAANSNCVAMMPSITGTNYIQATDFSGIANVSQNPTNGATLALGTNAVVLAVTDPYGNTAYSTNTVNVRDQTPPTLTLVGSNLMFCELGQPFTDPGVNASDDCSGLASVKTNGVVNVNAVGTNILTYEAIDGSGNSNSVTRTVIIHDTTPPTIVWSFMNLVLAANSNCVAMMPAVIGTNFVQATDLSGIATISQTPTNGATLALGTNVVVLAVTDPYGNTAHSTNTVVVRDQTPPTLTLVGSSLLYSELGQPFTDPGVNASDDCSGIALVKTNGVVNVNAVGTNILTYEAIDGSGNSNSVTRTVIVRDTTPPTIVWSFTNLVLGANSNCVAIIPSITGTNYLQANDLSGIADISQTPTNGATLALGTNMVVLAISDPYGNTAYSTNQIIVRDDTPPVILLQPQSQTNGVGAAAYFSVAATACTSLTFQWFFNDSALAAQTNDLLSLSNLNVAASGYYKVAVSASGGSSTSAIASLTVYVPPQITNVVANPDGSMALFLLGTPGYNYELESATNLALPFSWLPIATNKFGTNGFWRFTDSQATNYPEQFYRMMLAP